MKLPQAIQAYFEADRKNNCEALLACFTPRAAVHDEGRSHSGHYAIG
ncbi:MAG: nuclear transport factor 2 family protein, partial [Mesorhizobium sp.]